jgi:hypothetical protein
MAGLRSRRKIASLLLFRTQGDTGLDLTVQQPLAGPSRPRPDPQGVEQGVCLLDLDGPPASPAGDPQQTPLDVGEPQGPDRRAGWGAFFGHIVHDGPPVFGRHLVAGAGVCAGGLLSLTAAAFANCCASLRVDRSLHK